MDRSRGGAGYRATTAAGWVSLPACFTAASTESTSHTTRVTGKADVLKVSRSGAERQLGRPDGPEHALERGQIGELVPMLVEVAKHDIHGVARGLGQHDHAGARGPRVPGGRRLQAKQPEDCEVQREWH